MKYIDKAHWSRKDHFDYFRTFSYPHFNLCANMDITLFSHFVKQQKLSFFAAFLYVASRAANAIPEFRYRIRGEDIVEHDEVTPSVTVLTRHDTFSYVAIPWQEDFHAFVADARTRTQAAKNGDACIEDEPGRDDIHSMGFLHFVDASHSDESGGQYSANLLGKVFSPGRSDPFAAFCAGTSCFAGWTACGAVFCLGAGMVGYARKVGKIGGG